MQNTRISLAKPELPQAHNLHLPTFTRPPQISAPLASCVATRI